MPNLFRDESSNVKRNAQRNLCGRTHYVDDDTLRWHKSRVSYAWHEAGGLLFTLITKEPEGYRFTVFDVFGFVIDREPVDHYYPTLNKARAGLAAWLTTADAKAMTREAIAREKRNLKMDEQILEQHMGKIT